MRSHSWNRSSGESLLGSDTARKTSQEESGLSMREKMLSAQEETARKTAAQEIEESLDLDIQREAQTTASSRIGVISSRNENGSYNVKLCDGATLLGVQNGYMGVTWVVGTWVTVERAGQSDWQIVGISPYGAGVFTP